MWDVVCIIFWFNGWLYKLLLVKWLVIPLTNSDISPMIFVNKTSYVGLGILYCIGYMIGCILGFSWEFEKMKQLVI